MDGGESRENENVRESAVSKKRRKKKNVAQGCVSDSRSLFRPASVYVCARRSRRKKNAIWEGHICDVGNVVLLASLDSFHMLFALRHPPIAHKSFLFRSVYFFYVFFFASRQGNFLSLTFSFARRVFSPSDILRATYIDRYLRTGARNGESSGT